MSDIVLQHNVGALGSLKNLSAAAAATAGGTGDATTTTGTTIDRAGDFLEGSMPLSAALAALFDATLASGATLSIGYAVQDSPDGTNWSDYQTATYAVVATGPSGGGAVSGQLEIDVDLGSARQYVRLNTNPNLSAAGTDTAVTRSAGFFAGFDRLAQ